MLLTKTRTLNSTESMLGLGLGLGLFRRSGVETNTVCPLKIASIEGQNFKLFCYGFAGSLMVADCSLGLFSWLELLLVTSRC